MLHVHVYTCTSYAMLSSGLPSTGISHGSPYTCITDCKPSQMRLVRYSLENHKRALHNYFTMTVIENTMYCGQCNQCDTHAAHVCLFCFVLFCVASFVLSFCFGLLFSASMYSIDVSIGISCFLPQKSNTC